jgi:orotate phosphoribosyltransferase
VIANYVGRPGVLRSGHFRLVSGLHSDRFLAFSDVVRDEAVLAELAGLLAPTVAPWQPDLVLSPSTAGVALAGALASELFVPLQLASLDEHGRPDGLIGDLDVGGSRVLLVNDVVTTGDGLRLLADLVRQRGATVAGAAWFASRSSVDVPALIEAPAAEIVGLELTAVAENDCPQCAAGLPCEDALDLN